MLTKLDALNYMLYVNGDSPVSTLDSTDLSAAKALSLLNQVSLETQSLGWWFNRETMTLYPELSTGHVILPSNTLSVDPTDTRLNYVQRGSTLYDTENNTRVIKEPVEVRIVSSLPFNELPYVAASYVKFAAAQRMYLVDDGDSNVVQALRVDTALAMQLLHKEALSNMDINVRNSPQGRKLMRHFYNGQSTPNLLGAFND